MRIVTLLYPNKAYHTRVYLCYLGIVRYEIFDCRYNSLNGITDVHTGDTKNAPTNITDNALEQIQKFYSNIGLIVPERNNFVPEFVEISNSIVVQRNYEGLYDVGASNGYGTNKINVDLVKSLSYEKALIKAQDIAALCDK